MKDEGVEGGVVGAGAAFGVGVGECRVELWDGEGVGNVGFEDGPEEAGSVGDERKVFVQVVYHLSSCCGG